MATREAHPNFKAMYPRAVALGLLPVSTAPGVEHAGFDVDDVATKLGATRFAALMRNVTHVFSCGHRHWPLDHADQTRRGCEVHCLYATDLEQFLQAGG